MLEKILFIITMVIIGITLIKLIILTINDFFKERALRSELSKYTIVLSEEEKKKLRDQNSNV